MTDDAGPAREDASARYARPYGWWGPDLSDVQPRSLPWLVKVGSLGPQEAAFLSLAVELRRSLIIAAEPAHAGKTTLLTALLDFMDPDITPVYVRGVYERFEFMRTHCPASSYILCNEISAHLPTYMWGRGVRFLFDALEHGFRLATTMHAASPGDVLQRLQRFPLDVPLHQIGLLDLIVTLDMGYVGNDLVRRLTRIDAVASAHGPVATRVIAERHPLRAAISSNTGRMIAALASWTGLTDGEATRLLVIRERLISSWAESGVLDSDAVRGEFLARR